jgi:hypothetical protein
MKPAVNLKEIDACLITAERSYGIRWKVRHYFCLTRLYTWIDVVATGILGYFVSNPTAGWFAVLTQVVPLCILLWIVLNWISEYKQHDEGRIPPPIWLISLPLVFSAGIVVAIDGSLVGLWFVYLGLALIYPLKKSHRGIAAVCYLVRGLHTAVMFLLVVGLSGSWDARSLQLAVGLFFLQASRSLVAEVRDAPFDTLGLPGEIARVTSLQKSEMICFVLAILLGLVAAAVLGASVAVAIAVMICIGWIFGYRDQDHLPAAAYHIHRWFITASAAAKAFLGISPIMWSVPVVALLSFIVGIIAYPRVFRPINEVIAARAKRRVRGSVGDVRELPVASHMRRLGKKGRHG